MTHVQLVMYQRACPNKLLQTNIQTMDSRDFSFRPLRKERVPEETIAQKVVTIERKTFILALKENRQGRFMRITELSARTKISVVVPASGFNDFARLLKEMLS